MQKKSTKIKYNHEHRLFQVKIETLIKNNFKTTEIMKLTNWSRYIVLKIVNR